MATALLVVNGVPRTVGGDDGRSVLFALREELGLTGAKYGCGEGACGACTVLIDGAPTRACVVPVRDVAGRSITTVEGLARDGSLHAVQRAFVAEGAMQCGFCTPGMVVQATALLHGSPEPTDEEIVAAMDGNICRCGTYSRVLRAVRLATRLGRAGGTDAPAHEAQPPSPPFPSETLRPERPWDLTPAGERDVFAVLGDGLAAVLPPSRAPGSWVEHGGAIVHVGADGVVTGLCGKVEVGQGTRTALGQLVAEELRVSASAVRMVLGDTDLCPFDMGTFGSMSMPVAGPAVRAAAAAAREALLRLAMQRLGVGAHELEAVDGRVRRRGGTGELAYGGLVAGLRLTETAAEDIPLTPTSTWRIAGRPVLRSGAVHAVTGAARFPADITRPSMLHGAVLRPPALGSTRVALDVRPAAAVAGASVVEDGSFVGVVASDWMTATRARDRIEATWTFEPQPSRADLEDHLRSHPLQHEGWGGEEHDEAGDVEAALVEAEVRLDRTYTTAYVQHVPLETRAAVAEWDGDRLTVWTGTQRPFGVRAQLAEELGVPEERVRVIVPDPGAGFGGKHSGEVAVEAARLARAAGRPVKVRWSRAEEFTWAYFRPAAVIDVRSGARRDGSITAWDFRNVNSGAAALATPYAVPNRRVHFQPAASPLRQGSYRALAATANHFARESHMDELAHELGVDPLELRLRHLGRDERLATVLRAAAERAGWGRRPLAEGRGLGIAGGTEKGGRVAACAEVRVERDGRLVVDRIVTAFECGAIVDPDNLANQIEGATVMGLGGALFEMVDFEDGRVCNASMSGYRVPRFSDVPRIDVVQLDRPDLPSAGAGETPMVAVAPAIANAIFDAAGVRLRSMPLVPGGFVPRH